MSGIALKTAGAGMSPAFNDVHDWVRATLGTLGIGGGAAIPVSAAAFAGGLVLSCFLLVLYGLAAGFVVSFAFSAWTIMYFLLRKAEGGTGYSGVY